MGCVVIVMEGSWSRTSTSRTVALQKLVFVYYLKRFSGSGSGEKLGGVGGRLASPRGTCWPEFNRAQRRSTFCLLCRQQSLVVVSGKSASS
jgi:hypothetical protein